MRRSIPALLVLLAFALGWVALSSLDMTHAATPSPAGQVRLSPGGNDASCGRGGSACRSWSRALAVAQDGDTVSVAGGSYDGADLTGSKKVTFRVEPGQTATMTGRLELDSLSNATLVGPLRISSDDYWDLHVSGCSSNLELRELSGKYFDITDSSSGIRMVGGDWGGYKDNPPAGDSSIGGGYGDSRWTGCGDGWVRDVQIDGVRFHDVQYAPSSQWGDGHPDCLESHGAFRNLTIRNSTFERCGNTFFGLYTDWGSYDGLLMENNLMFDIAESFWGIQIGTKPGWTCANVVFRYNTFDPNNSGAGGGYVNSPPLIDCPGSAQVYGNIFRRVPPNGDCRGATWSYNVIEDGPKCGSNAMSGDAFYVARGSNYHLRPGSRAIGRGDPKRFPTHDADGERRALATAPDAGFDEARLIVPAAIAGAMAKAGDELAARAAATAVAGAASCGGTTAASDRLTKAVDTLGSSLESTTGKAPSDLCGLLASAAAGWNYRAALRMDAIANPPRDRSFRAIAKPGAVKALTLRGTTPASRAVAAAFNAQHASVATSSALLAAYATSVARAQAAGNAQDATWQDRQLAAARQYARQAGAVLAGEPRLRRAMAKALARAGVPSAGLTRGEATVAARSARNGLSPAARRSLAVLGLRRREADSLAKRVRQVGAPDLVGLGLTRSLVAPSTLASLRSAAASLKRLGSG